MFALALSAVACGAATDNRDQQWSGFDAPTNEGNGSAAGSAGAPGEQVDPRIAGEPKHHGRPVLQQPDGGAPSDSGESADAGDRPWWIVDTPDGGWPSSSGTGGAGASGGTGGIPGGSLGDGGIPQGSGGSPADPGTGGTSSSGTGGVGAGTGGTNAGTGGTSGAPTELVRCKVNSGEQLAGQVLGCDAETQHLFAGANVSWPVGNTAYFCASADAVPCARGGECAVYVNSTVQYGVCQ